MISSNKVAKGASSSSLSLPKNSTKSRKKQDKKSDKHFSKVPATQPFKTTGLKTGLTLPAQTLQTRKKSSSTRFQQPTRGSVTPRTSSTQNLFKPNPNLTNKNKPAKTELEKVMSGAQSARSHRLISIDNKAEPNLLQTSSDACLRNHF